MSIDKLFGLFDEGYHSSAANDFKKKPKTINLQDFQEEKPACSPVIVKWAHLDGKPITPKELQRNFEWLLWRWEPVLPAADESLETSPSADGKEATYQIKKGKRVIATGKGLYIDGRLMGPKYFGKGGKPTTVKKKDYISYQEAYKEYMNGFLGFYDGIGYRYGIHETPAVMILTADKEVDFLE